MALRGLFGFCYNPDDGAIVTVVRRRQDRWEHAV